MTAETPSPAEEVDPPCHAAQTFTDEGGKADRVGTAERARCRDR